MSKHRTSSQWAKIIDRYHRSDLTQVDFCERESIALSTLCYHLRRARAAEAGAPQDTPSPHLLELTPPPVHRASPEVRIELRPTTNERPIFIHCQAGQLSEILAQLTALTPSS